MKVVLAMILYYATNPSVAIGHLIILMSLILPVIILRKSFYSRLHWVFAQYMLIAILLLADVVISRYFTKYYSCPNYAILYVGEKILLESSFWNEKNDPIFVLQGESRSYLQRNFVELKEFYKEIEDIKIGVKPFYSEGWRYRVVGNSDSKTVGSYVKLSSSAGWFSHLTGVQLVNRYSCHSLNSKMPNGLSHEQQKVYFTKLIFEPR
jgi:hypothetical protein